MMHHLSGNRSNLRDWWLQRYRYLYVVFACIDTTSMPFYQGCGSPENPMEITTGEGTRGWIMPTKYPDTYEANMSCVWKLTLQRDYDLLLTVYTSIALCRSPCNSGFCCLQQKNLKPIVLFCFGGTHRFILFWWVLLVSHTQRWNLGLNDLLPHIPPL